MKVLFLTNIPSPYRVDFFEELGKLCELTVLYELRQATDRDAAWQNERARKTYEEVYLKPVIRQESSAWCPGVRDYLNSEKYDIIVVGVYSTPTGMQAIRYMKRHKIPYLISCDGGFAAYGERLIKRRMKTYFLSGARAYLSSGRLSDEYLTFYGADRERIYRFPFTSLRAEDILSKPVEAAQKRALREKLGMSEEKILLFVGSFIPRKGVDVLLRALARMQRDDRARAKTGSVGAYLVGGQETEEYEAIVEREQLKNVHFLPFHKSDELAEYYRAADLFVLPTREDIWGLVIGEALGYGIPVVTTDRCAAGVELLEDGAGSLVPTEDEKALAEAITGILEDDELRAQMGQKALSKISDYTVEEMAKRHVEIFRKAGIKS